MRHSRFLLSALALGSVVLGIPVGASAQFQLEVQSASTTQAISNGGNVNVVGSGIGQSTNVTLVVTYTGTGTATLSPPQLLGSSAFSLSASSGGAETIPSGQAASYVIVFTPSSGAQVQGSFSVSYSSGSGSGTLSLNLTGTSPSFVLGYAIQPQGNAVSVSNGGTLTFPATVVGTTTTALLTIENTGSAPGILNSFSLTGAAAFQTQSLPLLPITIGTAQALQITLVYTPTAIESDSGTLQMSLAGSNINIALAGTGVASQLTFQFTEGTQTLPVKQNQVSLPNTQVGTTATVSVVATNNGNVAATVNTISASGSGFQVVSAPPVPLTILPGASITLTLTFTPPQAGVFTAGLVVGSSTVTITAEGLGPSYQYSYTTGSTTSPVSANGNIFFATAQLGQSSSTTFTISNTGTAPGVISGIFIGEANSPFTITNLPETPLTLAVNQSVSFGITFTPTSVAAVSGTLHLDGTVFILNGAGGTPPAFPSYSFTAPTGALGPLQQPQIDLNIASPYPLAVNGTLTMTVIPDGFSADPSIQFSTGGKTVTFTIPANTTSAIFPTGGSSIELQTGSTAGTIVLTPTFTTTSNVPLTPAASQNLQLVVPESAPVLIGAEVTSQSAAGLTLAISGVSNSQTLTQLSFSFTTAAGYNVTGANVNVPVSSVASAWFESSAAQTFGGQFVATVPFTFTGPGSSSTSTANLTSAVTGVTITATNPQGTSTSLMVSLP
jgi:hypothetical protein